MECIARDPRLGMSPQNSFAGFHGRRVPGTFVHLETLVRQLGGDSFVIYGLHPELDYSVEINSRDPLRPYSPALVTLNGSDLTRAEFLRVPPGKPAKMEITLLPSATIAGAGPQKEVWQAEWIEGPPFPQHMYDQFFAVSGNGRFIFRGLPPGAYRIHPTNEKEPFVDVTVASGQTKEVVVP